MALLYQESLYILAYNRTSNAANWIVYYYISCFLRMFTISASHLKQGEDYVPCLKISCEVSFDAEVKQGALM